MNGVVYTFQRPGCVESHFAYGSQDEATSAATFWKLRTASWEEPMGEYWMPVNLTKGEFIHPHNNDCGLKLPEWNRPASAVRQLMAERWDPNDHVVAISDYGGLQVLQGEGPAPSFDWDAIEDNAVEIRR